MGLSPRAWRIMSGWSGSTMGQARHAEITGELERGLDAARGRRKDVDRDDRVRHLKSGCRHFLSAIDQCVRRVSGLIVYTYGDSIRQHVTAEASPVDSGQQGRLYAKWDLCVPGSFRRYGIYGAGLQLEASGSTLHPGEILVYSHLLSAHAAIV
jgi:hypothetical protein